VPRPDAEVTPVTLRKELTKVLPNYMMPTQWLAFDKLPQNANGKIDRPKLRERFQESKAQVG
jgi:acyl-coenzyme A synthetase/AMP-(fatty) acid ligase